MKKILLLVHAAQTRPGHLNWLAFRDMLQSQIADDITVEMSAMSELTFQINGKQAKVFDAARGYDIADFDLVVFRTIGKCLEEAISAAAYCRARGIKYIDNYIPEIGNTKISCAFVRWEHGLPVPNTVYGPVDELIKLSDRMIGLPAILKADNGKKGRDNYLVHSAEDIRRYVSADNAPRFVLQNFIPYSGDYRILVLNGKPKFVLKRIATDGSHLNNTSQGGRVEAVSIDSFDAKALDIAVRAAALEKLSVAGVDLIQDDTTGEYVILEVNRAPQLATGGFSEKKVAVYVQTLEELVRESES